MFQRDVEASVDWAVANFQNQKVPDGAGGFVGECLSLIKREYTHRTGEAAPSAGGWADGYLKLPGNLRRYFTVEKFDRNKSYPKGSYAVNVPTHHIMVYIAKSGDNVTVFEQNADPDHSPAHYAIRDGAKIDYIMVPIVQPEPAPAPAPVVHPYRIEHIDPKQVKINKDTHKWGLNYDNWNAIQANPEGTATAGDIKTVVAILHHNLGAAYYLENPDVASGYNIVDCDDYTAPVPAPKLPSAPVPFPTNKTPYQVVKTILGFTTSNNAINHTNATQTVKPGAYMIFNDRYDQWDKTKLLAVNVTKESGKAGTWINVADNVPDRPPEVMAKVAEPIKAVQEAEAAKVPAPAPQVVETEATIRNSFMWLQSSQKPVEFEVTQNFLLTDRVHGGAAINVPAGKIVKVYGTFEQGGRTWALVKRNTDTANYYMYGFPITSRTDFRPTLEDIFDFSERVLYGWELLKDNVSRLIQDVFPSKVKK